MMRLIFFAIALFLASRILGGLFKVTPVEKKTTVKGESKNEKLDLSKEDIVDVDFKEVKE